MGQSLLPTGANTSTSTSLDTLRVRLLDYLTSTMNSLFQPILLYLVTNSFLILAVNGKCHLPEFDNGVVEAEGEEGGNFLKGEFRCNTGYTMSGPSMLKCRNGIWSGTKPVCSVAGCDPNNLPHFVNGRKLRVKGTRDSVFKYKCNIGFRLFGPKNVYCTKNGWKMDEIPVCTRVGCNEEELLGNGIPHGSQRSMFQGAVYRFYCESGAMMDGNSAVYCDGFAWNGTKPECLVPPTTPLLSIELDGVVASEPLAHVGQQLKLVCTAQGGNPFPTLAFMLNGERVEGDNKEMIVHGGYNAVHTFTVEDHHKNLDMSCIVENRMSSIPVASNHQTLIVEFGPSSTYIHGAEMIMPDGDADDSCTSDVSNPASDITVQVTDQDGNDVAIEVAKPPKMKGNDVFASAMQFKFQVLPHLKSVFMKCKAANDVGHASTGLAVQVMYPHSNIEITGPDFLLKNDVESEPNNVFTCITDESNPAATIKWIVETDAGVETIQEQSTSIETISQGIGWKKISTLSLPAYQTESVKVHCIATIEELGFSKMSEDLVVNVYDHPESVHLTGPTSVFESEEAVFSCNSDVASSAPSLMWSLDGQDVTKDANQTDKMESNEEVTSVSVLKLNPIMSVHEHVLKCFVVGTDVHQEVTFIVEDLSVQLVGVIDGSELTEDSLMDVTCSVRAVGGLTSIKWYVDQQRRHGGELTPDDQGKMVSSFRWMVEYGTTMLECKPEVHGTILDNGAGVSFEVVEGDYGYGEDLYLDDDYEEEVQSLDAQQENEEDNDEEHYNNHEEENYSYEEENNNSESENQHSVTGATYSSTETYNTVSLEKSNSLKDATENEEQSPVREDQFDATKQQQSFSAAETGSAVLSHNSDSNKHISADIFSPKSLDSSSAKTWSDNIVICVIISSISRLLS